MFEIGLLITVGSTFSGCIATSNGYQMSASLFVVNRVVDSRSCFGLRTLKGSKASIVTIKER
jgi:hypothetical protein